MATNLPAILPKKAIENIKEKFPAEAAALEAVISNNIISLGVDECFALRDKDGDIKAFKQVCQLSVANGGLVRLPVGGGVNIISAQGYEMWAEKAAAQVIHPAEVFVNGETVPQNPAPLKNKDGEWSGWVVRSIAWRFTPMGIPQVVDRTVVFDVDNRKNIDFLAKAKKFKQAFRILAMGEKEPGSGDGSWVRYPFDKYSSLWVNAAHEEALDWYSEISQMIKNSLQLALTHADRNALKHLSGLQKSPENSPVWNIPVIAWRATSGVVKWDGTSYKNLRNKIGALTAGDRSEFKEIELTSGTDELGAEDILVVSAGEVDETTPQMTEVVSEEDKKEAIEVGQNEQQVEKAPEPPPPPPPKAKAAPKKNTVAENRTSAAAGPILSADQQKVMKNLGVMKGTFPTEYEQACINAGIGERGVTIEDASSIIKEMNRILEG